MTYREPPKFYENDDPNQAQSFLERIEIMENSMQMPRYQSHKKVWALQIEKVNGETLSFKDKRYADVKKPAELFARYKPSSGDYLVVYDDGYESFSPREPFEAGYTAL